MFRFVSVTIILQLVAFVASAALSFGASNDKAGAGQSTAVAKPQAASADPTHSVQSAATAIPRPNSPDKSGAASPDKLPAGTAGGQEQTLIFPSDRSMGRLCKVRRITPFYGLSISKPHFALAQGVIKIPADTKIRLELSYVGAEDATPLLKLHSKALISIDARDVDSVDDKTVQVISQLKNLWELRLDTTDVTDQGMESLKSMSDLVDLNIGRTLISAAGLSALKSLTSLQRLVVGWNKLTDDSIANVEGLKLVFLSIGASGLSDKALEHVAKVKTLRSLEVFDNKKITNKGVASLVDLPVLESLSLNGTSVDMRALESFKKMKKLNHLVLDTRNFQPADIVALRAALPMCDVQHFIIKTNVSPEVLAPLH
jgi:Leucine Rich repeat